MSWRKWMSQYETSEQDKFARLFAIFNEENSSGEDEKSVPCLVAEIVVAKLCAALKYAFGDGDFLSVINNRAGLKNDIAGKIADQIEPFLGSATEKYPSDIAGYPDVIDIAAPFLDVRYPKDKRKGIGFYCTTPPIIAQMVKELDLCSYKDVPKLVDHSAGSGALALNALLDYSTCWPEDANNVAAIIAEICKNWLIIEREKCMAAIVSCQLLIFLLKYKYSLQSITRWPVQCMDAFENHDRNRFTHAIGNPPYIGEKRARQSINNALKLYPELKDAYSGKADLSFLFLLHGILSLGEDGRLVYLTPAYWPTADGAESLRKAIVKKARVKGFHEPDDKIYSASGVRVFVVSLSKSNAEKDSGNSNAIWRIDESYKQSLILDKLEKNFTGLCSKAGPFQIKTGVQTGADKVTKAHLRTIAPGIEEGRGIYLLSKTEHEKLLPFLSDRECSVIHPFIKSPACGPFILNEEPSGYMIYLDGSTDIKMLPAIEKHLLPFKPVLEKRRECLQGKLQWWQLHWPREKQIFTSESILVPQRATFPRFGYAKTGYFTSVDVYHLLQTDKSASIFAWLALLHSTVVKYWLSLRGKRKGELYELYSTPLTKLPIPDISEKSAKRLDELSQAILGTMKEICGESKSVKAFYLQLLEMEKQNSYTIKTIRKLMLDLDEIVFNEYSLNNEEIREIKRAD